MIPLILLSCVEGLLRLCGIGGYPPTFVEVARRGSSMVVITDTPGPATFFFANRKRPGSMDQYTLLKPKPAGTVRIMLVGESAMKGYPEPMGLAASAFLREMLRDAWPGRDVDVINLGTTAIASFPVLEIMTESLALEPDLVIAYVGNNEFFGAYGVASLNTAGRSPTMIRVARSLRSLGLVQGVERLLRPELKVDPGQTLMEVMIGRTYTGPDDPLRRAAASNLHTFVGEMIERCKARGVPIMVCTLPCNERDLAPLGKASAADAGGDKDARKRYERGRTLYAEKDFRQAAAEFQAAIDLDPMPWRAPSGCADAVRAAVREHGALPCDVQAAFREASPGGCIGWELMDDHVHPSLQGQALLARCWLRAMADLTGSAAVSRGTLTKLPGWEEYAARLGDNPFDRYAVAVQMSKLGEIPFFHETNPQQHERFETLARSLESAWSAAEAEAAHDWQKPVSHAGGQRPISGMVARAMIREGHHASAEPLLRLAQRCVPLYSSWNLEYAYFMLACRERLNKGLSDQDRALAAEAIERGKLLLGIGRSASGMAERYVGRLHQLRAEYAEAVPFLLAARPKLHETDLVAIDQALVLSYVKTGRAAEALAVIERGERDSGQYAGLYGQMRALLRGR